MLLNIHQGVSTTPYDEYPCKISLYKTLTTLVTNHHWNFSPPIEYAISLLSKGQFDENPEVSFYCSTAIANLNSFIHPSCSTLQFPINIEDLKKDLNAESSQVEANQNGEEIDEEVMDVDIEINIDGDDDDKEIMTTLDFKPNETNNFIPEEQEILEIDNKNTEEESEEKYESDDNDTEPEENLKTVEDFSKSKEAIEISDEEIIAILDDKTADEEDLVKNDKTKTIEGEVIDLDEDIMLTSFVNIIN